MPSYGGDGVGTDATAGGEAGGGPGPVEDLPRVTDLCGVPSVAEDRSDSDSSPRRGARDRLRLSVCRKSLIGRRLLACEPAIHTDGRCVDAGRPEARGRAEPQRPRVEPPLAAE